jgi:transposase-like protein
MISAPPEPDKAVSLSNRPRHRIPDAVKQAIIADLAIGIPHRTIAKQLGISRQSVLRINHAFKRDAAQHTTQISNDWRKRIVAKSVQSVERALDDDSDSYKSASIAVASLKGLGVFTEQQMVGIHFLMESMPAEMKEIDVSETRTVTGSEKE